jgi:hypothetical protein
MESKSYTSIVEENWRYCTPLILTFSLLVVLVSRLIISNAQNNWDEELYFLVARGWRHMVLPYVGIFDHKPPAVHLAYLLLSGWGTHFGLIRVATSAFLLISSFVFVNALGRANDSVRQHRLLFNTAFFTYFAFGIGKADGLSANTEMLYIPALLLTSALLLRQKPVSAAIFAAIAMSIKYTCALDLFGIALFYWTVQGNSKEFNKNITLWIVAAILVTIMSYLSFYLYFKRYGIDLFEQIFWRNIQYGSSDRFELFDRKTGLFRAVRTLLPMYALGLWLNWRSKTSSTVIVILSIWFFLSMAQGMLTGKYYTHYFIPAVAPLITLIALSNPKGRFISLLTLLTFMCSLYVLKEALAVRLNHIELANDFKPHCQKIREGAYVMDKFIASYRLCGAEKVDKFVFPVFYIEPHFIKVSGSGGLATLKEKKDSGKIPGIIAGSFSSSLNPLFDNSTNNIVPLTNPNQPVENSLSTREKSFGFPMLITKAFKNNFYSMKDMLANGLIVPSRMALALIDSAKILAGLFLGFAITALIFLKLRQKNTDAPPLTKSLVLIGVGVSVLGVAFLLVVVWAVEKGIGV